MFIPLHCKSDWSLGYGGSSVERLVAQAARYGYPALALTDPENLYGHIRFLRACSAAGSRAISGNELRADPRRDHEFIIFEDETGVLEQAVRPRVYRSLRDRITTPGPYVVDGRLRRAEGAVHVDVERPSPFHERGRG